MSEEREAQERKKRAKKKKEKGRRWIASGIAWSANPIFLFSFGSHNNFVQVNLTRSAVRTELERGGQHLSNFIVSLCIVRRDWSTSVPSSRPGFKRGISFNTSSESASQARNAVIQKSSTTELPVSIAAGASSSLLPPTGSGGNKPVKSASFNVKPPPPRRLSWFSSGSAGEAARSGASGSKSAGGRTKTRTLSIDQGAAQQQQNLHSDGAKESEPSVATDEEPVHHQQQSPFGVLNHLRSSFKHYTSKNRNHKDVG